ncbi:hypothetical protein J6590_027460 [Homalodisca vitripennis]|nr:hypothetical protein J6590_027460 [Homalodisca vitripennis]
MLKGLYNKEIRPPSVSVDWATKGQSYMTRANRSIRGWWPEISRSKDSEIYEL